MLSAHQKFTLSILTFAMVLLLGSCSDKGQVIGPSVPKYLRGDINNNGVAYEVADAVLFSNYFVYGDTVFSLFVHEFQLASTDVNGDGLTLSVADLVYMIRIVVGDAPPNPNLEPVETFYTIDVRGTIGVDIEIGAAALQLQGNVEPTLLAWNIDMEYAFDAANNVTRVLIYSELQSWDAQSFTGEFINTNGGDIVSIEMATYEGARVIATKADSVSDFILHQNTPNPFDGRTTISFLLAFSTYVLFEIADEEGQVVFDFKRYYRSGSNEIDWYGTNNSGHLVPDGVYQYSLTVGGHKQTKQLILERHL